MLLSIKSLAFLVSFGIAPPDENETIKVLDKLDAEIKICENINADHCSEISPIVFPSDNTLFFGRANHPQNTGGTADFEDIWIARYDENKNCWGEPELFSHYNNKGPNYLNAIAYENGNPVFILGNKYTKRGMRFGLSYAKQINGEWSPPSSFEIEGYDFFGEQASFYVNEDATVLFTSGHPKYLPGSNDLYISNRLSETTWSNPTKLAGINTEGNEISPYLYDNKYLFFASDSLGGFGGMDLFVVKRLSDDNWNEWSEPVNLGPTFNDESDNTYFFYSKTLNKALITRGISDLDIYEIDLYIEEHILNQFDEIHGCSSRSFFDTVKVDEGMLSSQKCIDYDLGSENNPAHDYIWSFGDGNIQKGASGSHCYENPGTYEISMTLVDRITNMHYYDEITTTINIIPDLAVEISDIPDTISASDNLKIMGGLSITDDNIENLELYWSFGDGNYACGEYVEHRYLMNATYPLTVTCSFYLDDQPYLLSKSINIGVQ